jgi:aromatic-amino-acid transaminase
VRFDAMVATLDKLPPGTVTLFHACCHNPTGVDLDREQWTKVAEIVKRRGLVPFLDMAYQGFAEGLAADAWPVRHFSATCPVVVVANSFSKSLSIYGERVGALSIVTQNADEAARVLSQVKRAIRANYSSPPSYGSLTVATVLTTPELRSLWEDELGHMRDRIKTMRGELVKKVRALRADFDLSFVIHQRGMFSYSGLTREQVHRLRDEYSVYAVDSGRICVAALNTRNIDYVAQAVANVVV